jgi:hypothetical protein
MEGDTVLVLERIANLIEFVMPELFVHIEEEIDLEFH